MPIGGLMMKLPVTIPVLAEGPVSGAGVEPQADRVAAVNPIPAIAIESLFR
jgi:hypothetical protein